ncbi:hypothetical protein ACLMJK_000660 [Lecanora helva]
MALPTFNTKSPTIKRILKEASELSAHPDPTLHAAPLESNLFEWHFTIAGPPSTVYSNGIYHGRIVLPPSYPLRPPSFRFLTPSGRFEVNREICLSISGHHEETWQPAWGIRTALWALRAFMEGDAKGQVGGMEMPQSERERMAIESRTWRCHGCGRRSNEEILQEEGGQPSKGKQTEPVVPEELKLGFRDQIEKSGGEKPQVANADQSVPVSSSTPPNAPTAPPASLNHREPVESSSQVYLQPTRTIPAARSIEVSQRGPMSGRQEPLNGVPSWVDKAITGLVAALALMVFKKILV